MAQAAYRAGGSVRGWHGPAGYPIPRRRAGTRTGLQEIQEGMNWHSRISTFHSRKLFESHR